MSQTGTPFIENMENKIIDTFIEKPIAFSVNKKVMYLYPLTLGKMYLLSQYIKRLNLDTDHIKSNFYLELLRVVRENKNTCCEIIAIHTCKNKREVFDALHLRKKINAIAKADEDEIAALLSLVLNTEDVSLYKNELGITKDQEELNKVLAAKKETNSMTFGGVSIYGTLIDKACERYGWSYDYVVWGISYLNLQLMISDQVQQVYLSDEEVKNLKGISLDRKRVNADDKEQLTQYIKSHNWE